MGLKTETRYDARAPWEGLGKNVSSAKGYKQILKAAGLDWKVEKRALAHLDADGNATPFDDHYALVRDTDGEVLDVTGNRYIPTQNESAFEFFYSLGAKIETAGSLDKGRVVWALADLGVNINLPGRDNVKGYLFLGSPHRQGKSLISRMTALRDVCNNTIQIALRKGRHGYGDTFRMNHRNEFDAMQQGKAKEVLGLAREQFVSFGKDAQRLAKMKMTHDDAIRVLAPLFAPNTEVKDIIKDFDENATSKIKYIMDANVNAPGAQPNTAWGLLNAFTYYADHMSSKTPDRRLTHAWVGRTAAQKLDVLDALLQR